jgi:DHA2 family multidrug resistance protein-like MFS transporter
VLGIGLGAIWVRRQRRLVDPMIDIGLFRIRAFNTALLVNFLAIFVAVGYFLFVAQYLQLVVGLSPLEAGVWTLPSAVGFIVGSQLAPRIVPRTGPARLIGGGLALAAVGLLLLSRVGAAGDGLAPLIVASVVISLGLAPVFGLTTELIVGSAPPERAGAASGISETAAERGGALGIAVLGSVGLAIYRDRLGQLPAAVPADVAAAARDTLGAAVAVADRLPGTLGMTVVDLARDAFVDGMRLTALIAAIVALGLAALTFVGLREPGERRSVSGGAAEADEHVALAGSRRLDPADG